MPIDIDEEELQRILDQGSAYGPADDAEAFRRTLGPGDFEGDMPKGTRVNIEPEVSVPPRRVIQPRAAVPGVPAEKVVQVPGSPTDDFELAAAKQEDRMARSREAFERGTRQLIGGLTQTKAVDSTPGPVDAVAQLYARRKAKDDTSAKAEAGRLGAAKLNYDTKENARKAAEDKARDGRDFEYRQKHDAESLAQQAKNAEATRALAGASLGLRREEVDMKKTDKAEKNAAGVFPLGSGTFTAKPGLSDSMMGKAMDGAGSWNTALGNLNQLDAALDAFVRTPDRDTTAKIEGLLQGAMTSLNVAYKQGAMAETEATRLSQALGADVRSASGLEAAVRSWMGQDPAEAGRLLKVKMTAVKDSAKTAAINSLSPYGGFAEGAGGGSNPEDEKALAWAKANPKDPRAAEILKRLGAQ